VRGATETMNKKDYTKAAFIVQSYKRSYMSRCVARSLSAKRGKLSDIKAANQVAVEVENAFVKLFKEDNVQFNESLFREDCKEN
jgi:hypothetical protein